jgi:hypothetical protein
VLRPQLYKPGITVFSKVDEDKPRVAVDRHQMIDRFNRQILEDQRPSSDPKVIEVIKAAMKRPFGITVIERDREKEYRADLEGILDGPERMVTLVTFGGPVPKSYWREHGPFRDLTPAEEAECSALESWWDTRRK